MIVNGSALFREIPIENMLPTKERSHGVSHGLSEAGYDIRLKQDIRFNPPKAGLHTSTWSITRRWEEDGQFKVDRQINTKFTLASAMEKFVMPESLVGVVHDKSTWARRGLSVFNTVIEPGWEGYLTLELVYHGNEPLHLPAGAGIAQVLFSSIYEDASYNGKYQNQADKPVGAVYEANQQA